MNNTLLFIVVAIIIIAIVALFFLQKLQKKQGKLPRPASIDKQPTIKMADPRLLSDKDIANALSAQQAPKTAPQVTPQNELATVDIYIQNQDYQTAINELKRLLMTNPRHTDAMLKLLQVYGLTKQYVSFNQLHQKICEIADAKTVQDANFFKSLIDEEIASTQPATPVATPVQIDTLEFDVPTPTPQNTKPAPTPQSQAADDEILELDFGADELTNKQVAPPATPDTVQTDDFTDLGDFEFSFDTPNTKNATTKTTTPADITSFDDLASADDDLVKTTNNQKVLTSDNQNIAQKEVIDLDFNFGNDGFAPKKEPSASNESLTLTLNEKTPSNQVVHAPSADIELDFDNNQPAIKHEPSISTDDLTFTFDDFDDKTQQKDNRTTQPADMLDFAELSFDDKSQTSTTANVRSTDETKDFDFGGMLNDTQTNTSADDNTLDLSADFKGVSFDVDDNTNKADDFIFDFDKDTTKPDTAHQPTAPNLVAEDDFGFDFSSKTTQDLKLELDDDLLSKNDLELDNSLGFDTPSFDKANANNDINDDFISIDFDTNTATQTDTQAEAINAPVTTVQEIPVVITPTPATSLEDSLSIPTDDGIQITLELAKQYAELGEYDSAKRLLQEVVQDGLPPQKQEAHALMVTLS